MLHNLVVVMECLSALAEGDSLLTSRQPLIASRQLALDF
jgi:hypothetical protein